MFGGDLKIGRLAGIPISGHPLWLAIVALITWSLGAARRLLICLVNSFSQKPPSFRFPAKGEGSSPWFRAG